MTESITFNTAESKIVVMLDDGSTKEYTQAAKEQYIADYPDRATDVDGMGW